MWDVRVIDLHCFYCIVGILSNMLSLDTAYTSLYRMRVKLYALASNWACWRRREATALADCFHFFKSTLVVASMCHWYGSLSCSALHEHSVVSWYGLVQPPSCNIFSSKWNSASKKSIFRLNFCSWKVTPQKNVEPWRRIKSIKSTSVLRVKIVNICHYQIVRNVYMERKWYFHTVSDSRGAPLAWHLDEWMAIIGEIIV